MANEDECTFLCGYQRTRGYGSLANQHNSRKTYRIVQHEVAPNDTLQGIALKYNASMSEIKRLNRLWSNESLYLKSHIDIPVFVANAITSSSPSTSTTPPTLLSSESKAAQCDSAESAKDIFKRIDTNIAKSVRVVHKFTKNYKLLLHRTNEANSNQCIPIYSTEYLPNKDSDQQQQSRSRWQHNNSFSLPHFDHKNTLYQA